MDQPPQTAITTHLQWIECCACLCAPTGHPEYDPTTLLVPDEALRSLSAFDRQFWALKAQCMDLVGGALDSLGSFAQSVAGLHGFILLLRACMSVRCCEHVLQALTASPGPSIRNAWTWKVHKRGRGQGGGGRWVCV